MIKKTPDASFKNMRRHEFIHLFLAHQGVSKYRARMRGIVLFRTFGGNTASRQADNSR
jgi:hypothetical protein